MIKPLAEYDALVLAFIRSHPAVAASDIASELNIELARMLTVLYKLVKKGIITFNPVDEPLRYLPH